MTATFPGDLKWFPRMDHWEDIDSIPQILCFAENKRSLSSRLSLCHVVRYPQFWPANFIMIFKDKTFTLANAKHSWHLTFCCLTIIEMAIGKDRLALAKFCLSISWIESSPVQLQCTCAKKNLLQSGFLQSIYDEQIQKFKNSSDPQSTELWWA